LRETTRPKLLLEPDHEVGAHEEVLGLFGLEWQVKQKRVPVSRLLALCVRHRPRTMRSSVLALET
jgi:hypothetical protein